MAEFDAAGAKAAGYSDIEITKIQKGITDARAAGHSDADISGFLARTGGRVTPTATAPAAAPTDQPTTEGRGFPTTGADLAKNMAGPGPGELTNDPYGPPGERTNKQPSWLDSLFAGTGHGLGNVISGGARIGARMGEATDTGFGPELPKGTTESVDTTARQREQTYQASPEKKAHPYVAGAGEIAGETAGLLAEGGPMGLTTAPARAAPRWLMNLGLGTAGALATPKGDEGMDPASQLKRGAGGLVGAAAGTAAGELGSKLIGSFISRNPSDADVSRIYRRAIAPSRSGKDSLTDIQNHDRQIVGTFDDIIKQRKAEAQVAGTQPQYPTSIKEYLEAQNQQVGRMFQEYDAKRAGAQAGTSTQPNPHLFTPFRVTGVAVQEAQNLVKRAEEEVLRLRASPYPVGGNGMKISEGRLRQAVAELRRAQQVHGGIRDTMHKPYVDLSSVSNELSKLAQETKFAVHSPGTGREIEAEAASIGQQGFYGLKEAQDNIAALNAKLDAFYKNPTPAAASKAVSDAHLAGALRQKLDDTITKLDGPGYAALKKRYGDARQIEREIAAKYQNEAKKIEGGIGGIFADLFATAHGIKGIATLDPHALSTGLAAKGAQWMMKHLRDPNRAIQKLFIERAYEPGRARQLIGAMGRQQPMAYSIVGGQLGAEYQRGRDQQRDPRVPSAGP